MKTKTLILITAVISPAITMAQKSQFNILTRSQNIQQIQKAENISTQEIRTVQADALKKYGYNINDCSKFRITDNNIANEKQTLPSAEFRASSGNGYFSETFETAYGDNMPQGWTQEKVMANADLHWYGIETRIPGNPDPDNCRSLSIKGMLSYNNVYFDEWIISPAIQIKENSQLLFDVGYIPFYLYYIDYENSTYNSSIANADLLIKVRIYGEENWEQVFSLYNETFNLSDIKTKKFRNHTADLSKYSGKKVQIGFEYTGNGVPTIDLDNISIEQTSEKELTVPALYQLNLSPEYTEADSYKWSFTGAEESESTDKCPTIRFLQESTQGEITLTASINGTEYTTKKKVNIESALSSVAHYYYPEGCYPITTFNTTQTTDYGFLVPTDTKCQMKNHSSFAETLNWETSGSINLEDGNDAENPYIYSFISGTVDTPALTTSNSTADSTYSYSTKMFVGGNYYVWNIDKILKNGTNGSAMQGLGSSSAYQFQAIAEHYKKPAKASYIGSVALYFAYYSCASTPTLTVKIIDDTNENILGQASIQSSEAFSDGGVGEFYVCNFSDIIRVDSDFRIQVEGIPNNETDKLFFINEYFDVLGGKADSRNTTSFKMDNQWYSGVDITGKAISLGISPLIISPTKNIYVKTGTRYSIVNDNKIELNSEGGTLELGIESTFAINELPASQADWISGTSISEKNGLYYISMSYSSSQESRQSKIYLKDIYGETKEITVYQGKYTSTPQTINESEKDVDIYSEDSEIVIRTDNGIYNKAYICNLSGQILKTTDLTDKVNRISGLKKGCYIIQLYGKRKHSSKIIL